MDLHNFTATTIIISFGNLLAQSLMRLKHKRSRVTDL